jgi:hypothetical protein
MYGFRRAGADFSSRITKKLESLGWKKIRDAVQGVFIRKDCILVVYSDDMMVSGPRAMAYQFYKEIHTVLGFSLKSFENPVLTHYVGITREVKPHASDGSHMLFLQQCEFCDHLCRRFLQSTGIDKLHFVSTPMEDKQSILWDDEQPGRYSKSCREHIGGVFFLARGTRPDVLYTIARLGRSVNDWRKKHDRELARVFNYLWGTRKRGLVMKAHPGDVSVLKIRFLWDADWAGTPGNTKSTSGWALFLLGPRTKILVDFGSKAQTNTSYSTPEAEVVAGAMGLTRTAWPLQTVFEEIFSRVVHMDGLTDNSTALHDMLQGISKKMKHLRKHHLISISLINEAFDRPGCTLEHIASEWNTVDIFTKPLAKIKHDFHCGGLGLTSQVEKDVLTQGGVMSAAAYFRDQAKMSLVGVSEGHQGTLDFILNVLGDVPDDFLELFE